MYTMITENEKFPLSVEIGSSYMLSDGCFTIVVKDGQWKTKDLEAFKKNKLKCYLIEHNLLYGLMLEFENTPRKIECDIYFNANSNKDQANKFPNVYSDGVGIPIWLYVLDEYNVVKAMRYFVLGTIMSNKILDILKLQLENATGSFDPLVYLMKSAEIMNRYTTTQMKQFSIMEYVARENKKPNDSKGIQTNYRASMKGLNKASINQVEYTGLLELKDYTYYFDDGETGFVVMAVPRVLLDQANGKDLMNYECPVPCKYVIEKGFELHDGYVIVDAKYSNDYGLEVDDRYYEI